MWIDDVNGGKMLHDSLTLNLFVNNINYTLEEYNIDDLNVT
jgi:hypothetical protein